MNNIHSGTHNITVKTFMNVAATFIFFNQGASDYLQVELERDYCTDIICCIFFLYRIVVCMFAYDSATINFSVLTERVYFSHPTCISLYVMENSLKE